MNDLQSYEEFQKRLPLVKFSFYLWGRAMVLMDIREEILRHLELGFATPGYSEHESLSRAEMLMWLWTLGAYEIVRTMCQENTCFSRGLLAKLRSLKSELAAVRMPASKMEKRGKNSPVTSSRSATGIDMKNKDLLVGDPDEGHSAKRLLENFYDVFSGIREDDVVSHHESAYRNKG
jgi:hypothetical protein